MAVNLFQLLEFRYSLADNHPLGVHLCTIDNKRVEVHAGLGYVLEPILRPTVEVLSALFTLTLPFWYTFSWANDGRQNSAAAKIIGKIFVFIMIEFIIVY